MRFPLLSILKSTVQFVECPIDRVADLLSRSCGVVHGLRQRQLQSPLEHQGSTIPYEQHENGLHDETSLNQVYYDSGQTGTAWTAGPPSADRRCEATRFDESTVSQSNERPRPEIQGGTSANFRGRARVMSRPLTWCLADRRIDDLVVRCSWSVTTSTGDHPLPEAKARHLRFLPLNPFFFGAHPMSRE